MIPDTPLILLVGLGGTPWFFRHQIQAFARCRDGSRRHVIVPDWTAHVDPMDGTGALPRLASRLAGAWHDADLDGAIVVGHSLGGIVAALACGSGRFRPSGLLIIDSAIPMPDERRPFLREIGRRLRAARHDDTLEQRTRLRAIFSEFVLHHLASPNDDRDILDEAIDQMSGCDPIRAGLLLEAAAAFDARPALVAVRSKVWALAADPPRICPEAFLALRPDANLARVPGVGHMLPIVAAQIVNTAISCVMRGQALLGPGLHPLAVDSDRAAAPAT